MKQTVLTIILGVLLGLAGCTRSGSHSTPGADSSKAGSLAQAAEYYTCAMHPWVRSDKPGACPICGMALIRKSAEQQAPAGDMNSLQSVSLSPTQRVIANVATTKVTKASITRQISAVGVIGYAEPLQAKVAARFQGRIERLFVGYAGQVVRKGQPLFELHSPDLVSAEQDLILAAQGTRNPATAVPGTTDPEQLLDASRERLHMHFGLTHEQIAQVERQREAHPTLTFTSPISGTVIAKNIQEGQYVDEGTLLYQLADLSTVWVSLDVYEKDSRVVKVGQTVRVSTETYPDETFTGRVSFVSPVIDPVTRTVRVRTELSNHDGRLKPEMYVDATIGVPRVNTLVVPSSSVLSTGKRDIVWVEVKPNTFEPRTVKLGLRNDASSEVLEGLNGGEDVVSSGGFLLDSESQLQQPAGVGGDHSQTAHGLQDTIPKHVVTITVKGYYAPAVVRARQGSPLTLVITRKENSECTAEIVIKDFNIRRALPAFGTTAIEFTPRRAGRFPILCGMGMEQGTLIVE